VRTWKNILIVLGCGPNKNGTPTYFMRNRVAKAIALYKKNKYDVVIFSGGPNMTPIAESELMKILAWKDIPHNRMITENKSMSTVQNAVFTWELLKDKKLKKITIVTSSFHIPRAKYIFKNMYKHLQVKLIFIGSGEQITISQKIGRHIKEQLGLIKLKILGFK